MDCQYGPSLPDRPRWYYDENASTSSVRLQEAMIDVEEKETERLEGTGGGHGRRTGGGLDDESVPGSHQPKTQGAARRPEPHSEGGRADLERHPSPPPSARS